MQLNPLRAVDSAAAIDRLEIGSDGTIGAVEGVVNRFFRTTVKEPTFLELDLSACGYIEVPTLIYFIALIKSRVSRGLLTSIRIPMSESVRDFLRIWEFPRAVRQATGVPFHKFVPEGDRHYFGERVGPSQIRYSGWILDKQVDRLLSDRFFAITTFPINRTMSHARLVVDETKRWEAQLVKSVLKKHLRGPEGYFANRVIFESMTNALRHPSANIIQTVSRFDIHHTPEGNAAKFFTMVFWDDGESIITTLRKAIDSGLNVRSADIPELYKDYEFTEEDSEGKRVKSEQISSSYLPTAETPDEVLLLAATFPGVTRDVVGVDHLPPIELLEDEKSLSLPGMGLYVLTNCVVDIFGGTLSFRTKQFFMNIRGTSEWHRKRGIKSHYRAKVKKFDESTPKFLGNMLTIRLPLRDEDPQE